MKPVHYLLHPSPLGQLTLAATSSGLCAVYFHDQRSYRGTGDWIAATGHVHLEQAALELDEYFAGLRSQFAVALDLEVGGTVFQQTVWRELLNIAYGSTSSYGQHARLINKPRAVRAAAAAIGRNPLSIIVPCHRVLGSNGALTGYDGGLERKKYLLQLEGALQD